MNTKELKNVQKSQNPTKIKALIGLFIVSILSVLIPDPLMVTSDQFSDTEIQGYHFHTYYFQKNGQSTAEALALRHGIQHRIDNGLMAHCRLNHFNVEPIGPHIIGSFETCCNATSVSPALSFFMLNHGNLSILLHPLTRFELLDHTERRMFLGPPIPLDLVPLSTDLGDNVDRCQPIIGDSH